MSKRQFIFMFLVITAILSFEQWVLEYNIRAVGEEVQRIEAVCRE